MKIAAITDIHSNSKNLAKAITSIEANDKIKIVINCGDIGTYRVIDQLAKLDRKQYAVLSTYDSRDIDIINACSRASLEYFCEVGEIEVAGKSIGMAHEETVAKNCANYDVVFYGHLHRFKVEIIDGTLFVCCGEIMARNMSACYALYDTETGKVEKIDC
jgi:putative phosphoesterase